MFDGANINIYIYIPVFLVVLSAVSLIPVISYLMLEMTGSEALSTVSVSIFGLTYALSSLLAGFIHSIYRSELKIISYSLIGMFMSIFLFYSGNPWLFIIGRGAIGFFESFVFVGYIALLLNIFKSHEEGTYAIGKFFSIMGIGLVVGPLMGAAYVNRRLIQLSFPMSLVILVVAYLLVRKGMSEIKTGSSRIDKVFSMPKIGVVLLMAIIMVLSVGSVDGVIQSRSVIWFEKLGADPALGGLLMTIYYLFTIITETLIPLFYKKVGRRIFPYLLILSIATLILLTLTPLDSIRGDGVIYLAYLSFIALVLAIDMGIISPMGTERLVRSFENNYLIGSGLVNTIWSFSYFLTPSLMGYSRTSPDQDILVLTILMTVILISVIVFLMSNKSNQ